MFSHIKTSRRLLSTAVRYSNSGFSYDDYVDLMEKKLNSLVDYKGILNKNPYTTVVDAKFLSMSENIYHELLNDIKNTGRRTPSIIRKTCVTLSKDEEKKFVELDPDFAKKISSGGTITIVTVPYWEIENAFPGKYVKDGVVTRHNIEMIPKDAHLKILKTERIVRSINQSITLAIPTAVIGFLGFFFVGTWMSR